MEMSSKRPVSRKRLIVEVPKKETLRDPRFNALCGQFNEGLFKRSYGFVREYQKKETDELKEKISKEKNVELRM